MPTSNASGAALEARGEELYGRCEYAASAGEFERAYAAYRRAGDHMAAGRAARFVAWITGNVLGDWAVQNGWYARARTILKEAGPDSPEHGWVLIIRSFSEADPDVREATLREALDGFARAQLPMELASARLAMARSLAESSPDVAIAEAKSALAAFERLEAARHADVAAQVLRSLGAPVRVGPKGVGTLTKREREVLALPGAGLSNPEISDRLYISRKTVEHHVANILAKLAVRNRAEAAGYAIREQITP